MCVGFKDSPNQQCSRNNIVVIHLLVCTKKNTNYSKSVTWGNSLHQTMNRSRMCVFSLPSSCNPHTFLHQPSQIILVFLMKVQYNTFLTEKIVT